MAAACAVEPTAETTSDRPAWADKAWGEGDAPSIIDDNFTYIYSELPATGAAKRAPWAGNYWPTYMDNINHKWDGEASEAVSTKFSRAFDRPGLEDEISKQYGIDSRTSAKVCKETSECDKDKGEECSMREGSEEGKCIETWFGICHAWAPAAVMELEPVNPVTYNGVEFKVQDIKALVSAAYDEGVDVKFMSLRCDDNGSAEDFPWDEFGNPENDACEDTNPGAFHVVIANLLGLRGQSLVEDRTYDYQVWNQPIRSYDILFDNAVDGKKAQELGGGEGETYQFNDDAVTFRHVKMRLRYITESHANVDGNLSESIDSYTRWDDYEYVLELDKDGVVIGGEWIGESKKNHPDFLWLPTFKRDVEIAMKDGKAGTGIKWSEVEMLLEQSIPGEASTGFDWGGQCDDGDGEFEQDILKKALVEVGTVPTGKVSVRIELKSPADVDVQLIDEETGHEVIAWPNGQLNGAGKACTTYENVEYCYSGYNGDGSHLGYEWIEIRGETNRNMVMKAYGYAAGDSRVNYSWKGPEDCVDAGDGEFTQHIEKDAVVEVGVIPTGKSNLRIDLTSPEDVDVQLYDGGHPIVQWPDGDLSGAETQTLTYKGMEIEWSGYNGDGENLGHEYITVKGEVTTDLTMKAFGYAEGDAQVKYAWGLDNGALNDSL